MRSTSTGLLGVTIGFCAIAGAFAADMPIKAPKMPAYKAPRPVIADNVWSGLYFGGHVGGGGAWVREHYSVIDQTFGINSTAQSTRSGWVAGGGWEYSFLPSWSAFVEYNYIDIGTKSDVMLADPTFGPSPIAAKHQLQIAK